MLPIRVTYAIQTTTTATRPALEQCDTLLDRPQAVADQLAAHLPPGNRVLVWMRPHSLGFEEPDAVAHTGAPVRELTLVA